jgi:protein-S-isoprenylcysteine O-methyltransferase Ste14
MNYAFSAPRNWFGVPEAERATRAKLSADLCTIDCLGWSQAPPSVVILGDILIVIANIVFYFVFRENTYGAATIQRGFLSRNLPGYADYMRKLRYRLVPLVW